MKNILTFMKTTNQRELAEKTGVSRQYINLISNNGFSNPSLTFYNVCKFFVIKIETLDIESYYLVLQKHKKQCNMSFSKLSIKTLEDTDRLKRIFRKKTKSISLFIKIYKEYKNGL